MMYKLSQNGDVWIAELTEITGDKYWLDDVVCLEGNEHLDFDYFYTKEEFENISQEIDPDDYPEYFL